MRNKIALLGGVALGGLLSFGLCATADAKTVAHKHHAVAGTAAKVEALSRAVQDLEARLDAETKAREQESVAREQETQAREQLEAQVKAAQTQAAAAQADAQAAHAQLDAQIQTIPGVVDTEVSKHKPKPSWADNTTVTSTVFTDLSNIHQSPDPNPRNGTGFDVKRAYLGVDHTFNSIFSANLTVDFAPGGKQFDNGATQVGAEAIKYAWVQAKINPALIIQVGSAKTPWIPFVEDFYGQRYVEKVMIDASGFGNSADWGAFIHGSFADGILNYAVSATDGAGYKTPDRSTTMDFEGRVNVDYKGFVAAVGGYSGQEGVNYQGSSSALATTVQHTANRFDALAGYESELFHVGFEYYLANNWKNLLNPLDDKAEGYSAFGTLNFYSKFALFARYDWQKPSEDIAPWEKLEYFNVGLQYQPVKYVDLALVYKHDQISGCAGHSGCSFSDINTTLTPAAGGNSSKYDEFGLFTQFKF